MEHLDELLEADDVAHADHRRVHRDEVVEIVLGLGRLQNNGNDKKGECNKAVSPNKFKVELSLRNDMFCFPGASLCKLQSRVSEE